MQYRLGLDMGTNSLGWAALELDENGHPTHVLDMGVRIFPDGREPSKSGRVGDSLAVQRRLARGMRRMRYRTKKRIRHLLEKLTAVGLMPLDRNERKALAQSCPYEARDKAVTGKVEPQMLGRALFHLGLRRGFKSNRKGAEDPEKGKIAPKIKALGDELGNRTLGQYLHTKLNKNRDREKNGQEAKPIRFKGEDTEFYPRRAMYVAEFDKIRATQQPHQTLSDADWDELRDNIIFFQRPLRPVERGRCQFYTTELRAHKDLPVAQTFRIYSEVNNLRWIDPETARAHALDREQRDLLVGALQGIATKKTFSSMRNLKRADGSRLFPADSRFNLEDERRKDLKGNASTTIMAKEEWLGDTWNDLDEARQNDLFESLHEAIDDKALIAELISNFGFDTGLAEKLTRYPVGAATTNLSRKFMEDIIPVMRDQGLEYYDAVRELKDESGESLHHSKPGEFLDLDSLPYYGQVLEGSVIGGKADLDAETNPEGHFGKLPNPTVHVAMNQLRRLQNRLIARYGRPAEIHIELARDLKFGRQRRDEISREIATNERANNSRRELFAELGLGDASALDVKKIKLWEELGKDSAARLCPFSGKTISANMLFNSEVEIEHILPFSRTLDNSMANLTLATKRANQLKGNKDPFEAFGADRYSGEGFVWSEIAGRAGNLPGNKRWRFGQDAMQRFEDEPGKFLARQLTDTAFISRWTQRYMAAICRPNKIVGIPGRLTALIRGKWGLNGWLSDHNQKSRDDHRHHAVDALVVALTTRSVLQQMAAESGKGADGRHRVRSERPDSLLREAREKLGRIIVSHKPDHGGNAKLFKETAYGFIPDGAREDGMEDYNLVARKPLAGLTANQCEDIRDKKLRVEVRDYLFEAERDGIKHPKALANFAKEQGINSVRLLVKDQTVEPVASAPFKGYIPDSYICCDIWQVPAHRDPGGKKRKAKWTGDFWSYVDWRNTAEGKRQRKPHPAAKFHCRLFKNDMIVVMDGGNEVILRIAGFSTTNNKLDVRPHTQAQQKRSFKTVNVLCEAGLRKVKVLEDGRILGQRY